MAGIEREKMLEVILASSGNSWAAQNWEVLRDIAIDYPGGPKGMAKVGYKDISLAVTMGHNFGASLPHTALASQLMGGLFLKED